MENLKEMKDRLGKHFQVNDEKESMNRPLLVLPITPIWLLFPCSQPVSQFIACCMPQRFYPNLLLIIQLSEKSTSCRFPIPFNTIPNFTSLSFDQTSAPPVPTDYLHALERRRLS